MKWRKVYENHIVSGSDRRASIIKKPVMASPLRN